MPRAILLHFHRLRLYHGVLRCASSIAILPRRWPRADRPIMQRLPTKMIEDVGLVALRATTEQLRLLPSDDHSMGPDAFLFLLP